MITDVFIKRYPERWSYGAGTVPDNIIALFRQAGAIVFDDLRRYISDPEALCKQVHDQLVRELGYGICRETTFIKICHRCLFEVYDLWNDLHGEPDNFIKVRLSLIELLFRRIDKEISVGPRNMDSELAASIRRTLKRKQTAISKRDQERLDAFRAATEELNQRLRDAQVPFHYHNGFLQRADDSLLATEIEQPFWDLLRNPLWTNVDTDMKEAIDRRDNGGRDAPFYALKALESALKIISDEKGWTHGNERGAANYIDNLVSSTNGRFIDVWESEALKALFRDVRNPLGHGPGTQAQASLRIEQQSWVIETSMSWIKNLIRRL